MDITYKSRKNDKLFNKATTVKNAYMFVTFRTILTKMSELLTYYAD